MLSLIHILLHVGIHGTIRRALHAGKGHHIARLLAIALLLGRPVIARLMLGKRCV